MKKFIIVLLSFLNFSCVSSSKYQQLFDEHQIAISKNQKSIERINILERTVFYLENQIEERKKSIKEIKDLLQNSNEKNSLYEENIKKLNEELNTKNSELSLLNEKIKNINNSLNEEKKEFKISNNDIENVELFEQFSSEKNQNLINNFLFYIFSNFDVDYLWEYSKTICNELNNCSENFNNMKKEILNYSYNLKNDLKDLNDIVLITNRNYNEDSSKKPTVYINYQPEFNVLDENPFEVITSPNNNKIFVVLKIEYSLGESFNGSEGWTGQEMKIEVKNHDEIEKFKNLNIILKTKFKYYKCKYPDIIQKALNHKKFENHILKNLCIKLEYLDHTFFKKEND